MRRALIFLIAAGIAATTGTVVLSDDGDSEASISRRSNFSNEFKITTPEGINARGTALVRSKPGDHRVRINVDGLTPDSAYVIINHFFEPVRARGIGPSKPSDDPSCNGHFQFLGGVPIFADSKGKLKVNTRVDQLAFHVWVVDFAKFLEVTRDGTQAPASPDAFVTGGLLIPYADLVDEEDLFVDTEPLTNCS